MWVCVSGEDVVFFEGHEEGLVCEPKSDFVEVLSSWVERVFDEMAHGFFHGELKRGNVCEVGVICMRSERETYDESALPKTIHRTWYVDFTRSPFRLSLPSVTTKTPAPIIRIPSCAITVVVVAVVADRGSIDEFTLPIPVPRNTNGWLSAFM